MIFRSEIETNGNEKIQLINLYCRGRYKYHFGCEKCKYIFQYKATDVNLKCEHVNVAKIESAIGFYCVLFEFEELYWLFMLCGSESEGAHMLKSLKWWIKDLTPSTPKFFDKA